MRHGRRTLRESLPAGNSHGYLERHVITDGIFFVDLSEARFSESVARGPKTVYRLDPSTGASQKVASITGDLNSSLPDFCVSPDGKTLYYSIREGFPSPKSE